MSGRGVPESPHPAKDSDLSFGFQQMNSIEKKALKQRVMMFSFSQNYRVM